MKPAAYIKIVSIALGIAVIAGLIGAGQLVLATMGSDETYSFSHAIVMQTPFWVFWAPLVPLIWYLLRRFPIERGSFRPNILIHLAAALIISLAHLGFRVWFMHVIGHGYPHDHTFLPHFQESIRYRWWVHLLTYFAILGIGLLGDYYRKYRDRQLLASQLSAQLSQAKLQALRMQLNPHFLFNSLNNIAMLTRRNENATAVRMLAGLADLLRYVLEDAKADEVALREEIDFVKRYLEIERLRFADRLRIKTDIDEETLDAFVPNLILQPIVENAIQHGMAKGNPGLIQIAARKLGDRLILQVCDDGPGLTTGPRATQGVGLSNSRRRLEALYGEQFGFDIRNGDTAGVVVTISIPFHTQPVREAISVA